WLLATRWMQISPHAAMSLMCAEAHIPYVGVGSTPTSTAEDRPANSLQATRQPGQWVVERLSSWHNRSRRLLIRREKLASPYEAFLTVVYTHMCLHQRDLLSV